jgi:Tfp pilus assembly protein PilO
MKKYGTLIAAILATIMVTVITTKFIFGLGSKSANIDMQAQTFIEYKKLQKEEIDKLKDCKADKEFVVLKFETVDTKLNSVKEQLTRIEKKLP